MAATKEQQRRYQAALRLVRERYRERYGEDVYQDLLREALAEVDARHGNPPL